MQIIRSNCKHLLELSGQFLMASSSVKRGKTLGFTLRVLASPSLLTLFLEALMASLRSTSAEKRIHQPGYPELTCLLARNLLQLQTPSPGCHGHHPQRGGRLAEARQHLRHPGAWSGKHSRRSLVSLPAICHRTDKECHDCTLYNPHLEGGCFDNHNNKNSN